MLVRVKLDQDHSPNSKRQDEISGVLLSFRQLDVSRHEFIPERLHGRKVLCKQSIDEQEDDVTGRLHMRFALEVSRQSKVRPAFSCAYEESEMSLLTTGRPG